MAPPPAGQEYLAPALALPPGIYFDPTKAESVGTYLNGWIAGHDTSHAEGVVIKDEDVYRDNPDVLLRTRPPASTRESDPVWWFLCHYKMQATRGGAGHRGDRSVATGGYWKLEQTTKEVRCAVSGQRLGFSRNFGFHVDEDGQRNKKTRWLMEEFTSVDFQSPDKGTVRDDGKTVLPALHKIYISPGDPDKKKKRKKRARDDEVDNVRVAVPPSYIHAVAAMPQSSSSARGAPRQEHQQTQSSFEAPRPPPGVFVEYKAEAASSDDDHGMTINENILEEAQGSIVGGDSPELRALITVDDAVLASMCEMGADDALADASWIDEHYTE